MRTIFFWTFILFSSIATGQSYDISFEKASIALEKKDFKDAYHWFTVAFKDSSSIGKYDLTAAAFAASESNNYSQAIEWLEKSISMGLGKSKQELDYFLNDTSYYKLHNHKEWPNIVKSIKNQYLSEVQKAKLDSINWIQELEKNKISESQNNTINPGFALYFHVFNNMKIPYLIYIPINYTKEKSSTLVFLHGGVSSMEEFNYKDPSVKGEPIFSVADSLNLLIIYPFGKKDFGWVNQKEAFENILNIVNEVKMKYHLEHSKIYLGGMSNGGSATFWFASQKPNIFNGFFAISAFPKLNFSEINFDNISQNKPFIMLNDLNDKLYEFDKVNEIYIREKAKATDWKLNSISSFGHGFIYNPENGTQILNNLISNLIEK